MDENLKAQIEALEKENLTYAVQLSEAMSARETQHGLWVHSRETTPISSDDEVSDV